MLKFNLGLVFVGLSCTLCAAPQHSDAQLAHLHQLSSENAMLVRFANPTQARRAAISLHDALLAGDWQDSVLILQLDAAAQARLAPHAVSITPAYIWQQQQAAIQPQALAAGTSAIPGFSCYSTVEETYSQAEQLVRDYPDYASWQKIGSGWSKTRGAGGYDLFVLKISNSKAGPAKKAKLLVNSAIHAREYATAGLTLEFAKNLLAKTGKDADVDWMLQQNEVHLVLQTNPEGRKIAETGVSWRKNINNSACGNNTYGVDLNRNFSFGWFSIPNGSSDNSCALTYRGPSAGSEPEVQTLQSYARSLYPDMRGPNRSDAAPADTPGIHIDVHSFSELVLWPWGDTETPAPNGTALKALGHKLAWFNGYMPTQSIGLYPTDGTSDGVSYGELGVAAITFEIGTAFFESCANYQANVLPDNMRALYYALRVNTAPYLLPAGPDVTQLSLNTSAGNIARNLPLVINAVVSDTQASGASGGVPNQSISSVELTLDQWPQPGIDSIAISAADGKFDSANERISHSLDLTNLSEGRHTLYLRSKDSAGNVGPVYAQYFTVTAPVEIILPEPDFSVDCQFLRCQFNNTTPANTAQPVQFSWAFTATAASTETSPVHTFATPGTYTPVLTVKAGNLTKTRSKPLQVYAQPQLALSGSCQALNCSLTANASSANGSISSVQWTVNNQTLSGNNVTVTFSSAGSYEATAVATDSAGQKVQSKLTLTASAPVVEPPPPAATANRSSGGSSSAMFISLLTLIGWMRRREPRGRDQHQLGC
jgi:carboxypeptidase T